MALKNKTNNFSNFFQEQTVLDDSNAVLPDLTEPSYLTSLSSIAFDPQEVEEIFKTLKTDNASGSDGLNNHILKEVSHELSSPLCSLFNKSLSILMEFLLAIQRRDCDPCTQER